MEDTLSQELGDRRKKDKELKKMRGQSERDTYMQVSKQKKLWRKDKRKLRDKRFGCNSSYQKERISHNSRPNTITTQGRFGGESRQKCGGRKRGSARRNGYNVNENDQEMEDQTEDLETNGRVDLYGDEGDRRSDSSLSMTTKIKNVEEGKSSNFGKKKNKEVGILEEIEKAIGNRFSNRLAPMSDIPIMDKAKNRAMVKNLQSSDGTSLPTLASTSDYCILDIASRVKLRV
jgi:hypothetical protein